MIYRLETACFSLQSALTAIAAGTHRIEFCHDYSAGGVSPSLNDFTTLRKSTEIPIYVMLRPRPGNFVYQQHEMEIMAKEMQEFASAGADGFVFGILNENHTINISACKWLCQQAGTLPCTFHRAFDRCPDPFLAIRDIIHCGFKSLLTSGKEKTAFEGAGLLNKLVIESGNKISIIAGGGIRSSNIKEIHEKVKTTYYHSAGITSGLEADREEIEKMIEFLKSCSE